MGWRATASGRWPETGAVLLTVMLVMLGLLGLGITALWLTSGSLQIGSSVNLRNQALYVAEMGIEQVRADLNTYTGADLDPYINPGIAVSEKCPLADDFPSVLNPNGKGAIYRSPTLEFCDDQYPAGTAQKVMGRYTVYIKNDKAELKEGKYADDVNNVAIVRSEGRVPDPTDPNNVNKSAALVVIEITIGLPPGVSGGGGPGGEQVLEYSGKNAASGNDSVQSGFVVQ